MEMYKKIALVFIAIAAFTAIAFSPSGGGSVKLPKLFTSHYAYVSPELIHPNGSSDGSTGFYISKTEVDHMQYMEFLSYLKLNSPELLATADIDTSAWMVLNLGPFANYYHKHPAYNHYPVVNVSHEAAVLYCEWLTEFNQSKGLFVELEGYKVTYRLPTHAEWLIAAKGEAGNAPYAWGNARLRDKKGNFMANFQIVPQEKLSFDPETGTFALQTMPDTLSSFRFWEPELHGSADVTAPVLSYAPNDLGLYNMNGNVAEMLSEPGLAAGGSWIHTGFDIRNESLMTYEGPSPLVGFRTVAVVEKL